MTNNFHLYVAPNGSELEITVIQIADYDEINAEDDSLSSIAFPCARPESTGNGPEVDLDDPRLYSRPDLYQWLITAEGWTRWDNVIDALRAQGADIEINAYECDTNQDIAVCAHVTVPDDVTIDWAAL